MRTSERHRDLQRLLRREGELEFGWIAERYGVSEMTARRDVQALEVAGVARRVRGGAIALEGRSFEPSFGERSTVALAAKKAIARLAVTLLAPGESVLLDSGTTVLEVARCLRRAELALTIVTSNLFAALEVSHNPVVRTVVTGGFLRTDEGCLVGTDTERGLQELNCDTVILGAAGVSLKSGVSEYGIDEARVKQAALHCARRAVLVVDATKLDRVHFARVSPITSIDSIVTDAPPTHPILVGMRQAGVTVLSTIGDVTPHDVVRSREP